MCLCLSVKRSCDVVPSQELWAHGRDFGWSIERLWEHLYHLGSTVLSTKEMQEDLIGDLADHSSRDQKFQTASSDERLFFSSCLSRRLQNVNYLHLQPGDLASHEARKHTANRLQTFGVEMRVQAEVAKEIKKQCRKGGSKHVSLMRLAGGYVCKDKQSSCK